MFAGPLGRSTFTPPKSSFDSPLYGLVSLRRPVLRDGTAAPLPIPARRGPKRFRDVRWRDGSLGTLVEDLTGGRGRAEYRCHLDPDLQIGALSRQPGWRPAFGQHHVAQRHLERQGVGRGDLFLYFGLFRAAEQLAGGTWRYVRHVPSVHRLFGWLQVSEVVRVGADTAGARAARPWLSDHPHVNGYSWTATNTIYVSTRALSIGGRETLASGGGLFSGTDGRFTLTAPEARSCSYWRLPGWFLPSDGRPSLSYHGKKSWWRDGLWVYVESASPGQEFVFNADGIPEADAWLNDLFDG